MQRVKRMLLIEPSRAFIALRYRQGDGFDPMLRKLGEAVAEQSFA